MSGLFPGGKTVGDLYRSPPVCFIGSDRGISTCTQYKEFVQYNVKYKDLT